MFGVRPTVAIKQHQKSLFTDSTRIPCKRRLYISTILEKIECKKKKSVDVSERIKFDCWSIYIYIYIYIEVPLYENQQLELLANQNRNVSHFYHSFTRKGIVKVANSINLARFCQGVLIEQSMVNELRTVN